MDVGEQWFDVSYWQRNNKISGTSTGRNTTYFFQHGNSEFVLRHYYRGGLFGKLINDSYWYSGIENTRAFRELDLLQQLRALGLHAPIPTAAKIIRSGLSYSADIIIEKIPNATDAFHLLLTAPLSQSIWQIIGQCIRAFHNHQVYHSDLNIHNIMIDTNNQAWLIDFDKGEIRDTNNSDDWKQANLDRLKRSLLKEQAKHSEFHWQEEHWQWLVQGYQA